MKLPSPTNSRILATTDKGDKYFRFLKYEIKKNMLLNNLIRYVIEEKTCIKINRKLLFKIINRSKISISIHCLTEVTFES